jgi:hypothetical protein
MGIPEWDDFMLSMHVRAFVPAEPRRAVPLVYIRSAMQLARTFEDVQNVVLQLFLLFSFSRSESPCCAAYTGEGAFDDTKNLQVKDVEIRNDAHSDYKPYVVINIKGTKTDPRMERPEAAGGEDWCTIGDLPGSIFGIVYWIQRLFKFHGDMFPGGRPRDSPFFIAPTREWPTRPLRYGAALEKARELWGRVAGAEEASRYGLHGLRVAGYDAARRSDAELAVAQGGWKSTAHKRYDRFNMREVLAIPSSVVEHGLEGCLGDGVSVEAPLQVESQVQVAGTSALGPMPPPPAAAAGSSRPLPPGYVSTQLEAVVGRGSARLGKRKAPPPRDTVADAMRNSNSLTGTILGPAYRKPLQRGQACVGRLVLVPAKLWPDYSCDEHGGEGWEAQVRRCANGRATVKFLHARDAEGNEYPDEHLSIEQLVPL